MKQLILLLFASCIALVAVGQEADDNKPKKIHEFGLNATLLLDVLLDNGQADLSSFPYLFTYKSINQYGQAFRLGFGGTMNYIQEVGLDRKEYDNSVDLRLGFEKQWILSPKWTTSMGMDFLGGYGNFGAETDFATTSNLTWNAGVGPVLGIHWTLGSKIGLSTETAFYYKHIVTTEKVKFEDLGFPQNPDSETTTKLNSLNFVLPSSIFLFVRF